MKEQFNLNVIDHSQELQTIKEKYGEFYFRDERSTQEAAALWGGLETNKHGVATSVIIETLIKEKGLTVEIKLARTLKDHWLIGLNVHASTYGMGYMPSAWDREGYADYGSARKEAIQRLKDYFTRSTSIKEHSEIIRKLTEAQTPQLSFF